MPTRVSWMICQAVLADRVSSDCFLTIAISFSCYSSQKCVRSWLSCHSKSVTFPEMYRDAARAAVGDWAGPRISFHCKRCLILLSLSLMKSHKPLPSSSLHLLALTICHLLLQHPWLVEREQLRADRPSFIPGEMGCSWAAPGASPLIRPLLKPHYCLLGLYPWPRGLRTPSSLHLSFIFSQRLCHALLWWGTCRFWFFLRQSLRFFQQQGRVIFLCNIENKNSDMLRTYSMFGSRLIFQPWWKFHELSPLKRLNILKVWPLMLYDVSDLLFWCFKVTGLTFSFCV